VPISFIEVIASQFPIVLVVGEEMIDHHQQRMRDRNRGLLAPSAQDQAVILDREIAVLGMDGGMRSLH
jgi:hypothetical protein